jgi:pseudouridine-5'-phosphate glycosidase/pseudouridine kinase
MMCACCRHGSTRVSSCSSKCAHARAYHEQDTRCVYPIPGQRTAVYNGQLTSSGELLAAGADMAIHASDHSHHVLSDALRVFAFNAPSIRVMCFDGNYIAAPMLRQHVQTCQERGIVTLFEPTSDVKAPGILALLEGRGNETPLAPLDFITPNRSELRALFQACRKAGVPSTSTWRPIQVTSGDSDGDGAIPALPADVTEELLASQLPAILERVSNHVILKMGSEGCLAVQRVEGEAAYQWAHLPAPRVDGVVSVTGAGDSMVGALAAGLAAHGGRLGGQFLPFPTLLRLAEVAMRASTLSLHSERAVSPRITPSLFDFAEILGKAKGKAKGNKEGK